MIEILRSGLYDSIQDLGRSGFQSYGVPISGVMDRASAKLANGLLNNTLDQALIEMTLIGPKLKFHSAVSICVTGAHCKLILNGLEMEANNPISINVGDDLEISAFSHGARAYLAVTGGFKTPMIMNSSSQYQNITEASRLKKGDFLELNEQKVMSKEISMLAKVKPQKFSNTKIEVYRGPEYDLFKNYMDVSLFSKEFEVSSMSNRMAYQFTTGLKPHDQSIITSAVLPGTVQYTPSGKLVVLMRDAQTTGGYPRLIQLSESSIDLLSQKQPNERINFELIAYEKKD